MTKSRILFNEQPLVVNAELAKIIGLNEAIIVQQLSYWLDINQKARREPIDGRFWTYNSVKQWQETNFTFWSIDTIQRTLKKLEKSGIVIAANHHKNRLNRSKWYTLDYEKLDEIVDAFYRDTENHETSMKADNHALPQNAQMDNHALPQNAQMHSHNLPKSIYTETTTENKEEEEEVRASEFKDLNEALLFAKSYVDLRLKNRDRYDFICDLLTIFFADLKTLKKSSIQAYCLKVLQQHDQPPVEVEVNNVTKSTKARSRSASRTETMIEYDNEPLVRTPEEEAQELERIKNLMKDLK